MPPKKAGAKGKGKAAAASPTTGADLNDLTKEQVIEMVNKLRAELDYERQERNAMQTERDMVNNMWHLAKDQSGERHANVMKKERQLEDTEQRHQVEIKVYKQKVKHLMYEHQARVSELKLEGAKQERELNERNIGDQQALREEIRALKESMRDQELEYEEMIKDLKTKHDEHMTKSRQDFVHQVNLIEAKFERRLRQQREELETHRKTEVLQIEELKNEQINQLLRNHEKSFNDLKNYYNDITMNNLQLINELKKQVEDMKTKEERMEKLVHEVQQENKHLREPLAKAQEQVLELKKHLANYEKDKASLNHTMAKLKVTSEDLKNLQWEHEVLRQTHERLKAERDDIYSKFVDAVMEIQQRIGLKNVILEKKHEALAEKLEKQAAYLNELVASTTTDPSTLAAVQKRIEELIDSKNAQIKRLQYDLAKVSKAHNDMLRTFVDRLRDYSIPVDDLGFRPLTIEGLMLGDGPSRLVTDTSSAPGVGAGDFFNNSKKFSLLKPSGGGRQGKTTTTTATRRNIK